MPSYVGFLRAINLGRTRPFPMADLRRCLERAGFRDVETYIQTGNVRVSTSMRSVHRVAAALEEAFEADRGFAVPTVVLTPAELAAVYRDAESLPQPFPHRGEVRRYVTFLKQPPAPDVAADLEAWDVDGERAAVRGRAVHWWLAKPTAAARLGNALIERRLGLATTRDLKVVTALATRWTPDRRVGLNLRAGTVESA